MTNWRQWKRGLWVSFATGALTGLVGLSVGVSWKQAAYLIALTVGKDLLLYLTDAGYRQRVLDNLPSGGNTDHFPNPDRGLTPPVDGPKTGL